MMRMKKLSVAFALAATVGLGSSSAEAVCLAAAGLTFNITLNSAGNISGTYQGTATGPAFGTVNTGTGAVTLGWLAPSTSGSCSGFFQGVWPGIGGSLPYQNDCAGSGTGSFATCDALPSAPDPDTADSAPKR